MLGIKQLKTSSARPKWLISLVIITVFVLIFQYGPWLYKTFGKTHEGYTQLALLFFLRYSWFWIPPVLIAIWLVGVREAPAALGLEKSPLLGVGAGMVGTIPLLLGFIILVPFSPPEDILYTAIRRALLPGIMEEILYRGMLFGLLFRFSGWGFLPATLVGAILFGAAHFYQGEDLADSLAIFAITLLGAIWFSWLYVESRFNLWVPISFHVLMNFYWDIFGISNTALGPMIANYLRVMTILISVVVVTIYARRHGGRILRGKAWIFNSKNDDNIYVKPDVS